MRDILSPDLKLRDLIRARELRAPAVIATVVANLFPLLGVFFLHWDVFVVLLLYLCECAVIALYNVIKLIVVARWRSLYWVPVFLISFSIAALVPIIAVGSLWDRERREHKSLEDLLAELAGGAVLFAISHGFSFVVNYIGKREYARISIREQFFAPFRRSLAIVVAALTGFMLILVRDDPLGLFVMLAILVGPAVAWKVITSVRHIARGDLPLHRPVGEVLPRMEVRYLWVLYLFPAVLAVILVSPIAGIIVILVIPKIILDVRAHLLERQIV